MAGGGRIALSSIHGEGCSILFSPQGRWHGIPDESLLRQTSFLDPVFPRMQTQMVSFQDTAAGDPAPWGCLSNAESFSPVLYVTWEKLLNLSGPQFSHLKEQNHNHKSLWQTFSLSCRVTNSLFFPLSLQAKPCSWVPGSQGLGGVGVGGLIATHKLQGQSMWPAQANQSFISLWRQQGSLGTSQSKFWECS